MTCWPRPCPVGHGAPPACRLLFHHGPTYMQVMDRRGLADAREQWGLIAAAHDVPEPICQPLLDGSAARREAQPAGVKNHVLVEVG